MKVIVFLCLISATFLVSCDPLSTVNFIAKNDSDESVSVILEANSPGYDTITIEAGGEDRLFFDDAMTNSVAGMYESFPDTLTTTIVDILSDSVSCTKKWQLKSNWKYTESDHRTAEMTFVITNGDF
jgi:hypothetical protein